MLFARTLWGDVCDIDEASQSRPLAIIWGRAAMRSVVVAVLGSLVFRYALSAGLLSLCGFLVGRSIYCACVMGRVSSGSQRTAD